MKSTLSKLSFLLGATFFVATTALGQQAVRYQFDNFDTTNGIRIELPPSPVFSSATAKKKPSVRSRQQLQADSTLGKTGFPQPQLSLDSYSPTGGGLDGFTTGNKTVDSLIQEAGGRNGVDPVLLYAVMHQESTFKQMAISPKGARGLMQLMPGTAARFGVKNIFDPRENIEGGAKYMRFLLNLFQGNVELALAGYNAGEGAVMKYGHRIPPYRETQEYVRRISKRYALMRDPMALRQARTVSSEQLASIGNAPQLPLSLYERTIAAVRLPDGRLQLVSQ